MMRHKLLYYIAFITLVTIMGIAYTHSRQEVTVQVADDNTVEQDTEAEAPTTDDQSGSEQTKEEKKILVHICGAVKKEGVYEVEEGARVYEALERAGGLLDEAATDYVNLAREIQDGEQVTFPTKKQIEEGQFQEQDRGSTKININRASASELTQLSGVGEARAKLIVAYRTEKGPYKKIEDIMQVSGIKEGLFQKIKDSIIVK